MDANCAGCRAENVQVWLGSKCYTQKENEEDASPNAYCSTCSQQYLVEDLEKADVEHVEQKCEDAIPEVKP